MNSFFILTLTILVCSSNANKRKIPEFDFKASSQRSEPRQTSAVTIDFTKVTSIYNTPMNHFWGDSSQMSLSSTDGLLVGSGPNNDYSSMGVMIPPTACTQGYGYGNFTFVAKFSGNNTAHGGYLLLWRGDNQWISSKLVNSDGTGYLVEDDLMEVWSSALQSTGHYYNSSQSQNNGQIFHQLDGVRYDQWHTITRVWAANLMIYYLDGVEKYRYTGEIVPKDNANGGCNFVPGVGAETETSPCGIYLKSFSWTPQGGSPAPPSPPPASGIYMNITNPGTLYSGATSKTLTVYGTGLTSFYWVVVSGAPNYSWRGSLTQVSFKNNVATITPTFVATGDFIKVNSDNTNSPAFAINSSPVTMTANPAAYLNITNPGTLGNGETSESLTVYGQGLTSFYWVVVSGAPNYSWRGALTKVTLTNGLATIKPTFVATGDFVKIQSDNSQNPAFSGNSNSVTLTSGNVPPPSNPSPPPTPAPTSTSSPSPAPPSTSSPSPAQPSTSSSPVPAPGPSPPYTPSTMYLNITSPGNLKGKNSEVLTVFGTGLTTVYWVVVSGPPSYTWRGSLVAANLTNNIAMIKATFVATGDFVKVSSDKTASPSLTINSNAVTLSSLSASEVTGSASTIFTSYVVVLVAFLACLLI